MRNYNFTCFFNQTLRPPDENTKFPTIEIIPANLLTFQSPEKDWFYIETPKPDHVKFRIVVSHMPILPVPNPSFSRNVMNKLEPTVIFSAHDHRGLGMISNKMPKSLKRCPHDFLI